MLVIDDDPDVRGFMAEALADQHYRVREAADGKSGLKAYQQEKPDLVVLDFVMPELSGADVAKEMLAEHPDQKILFVSGYSETEAIKRDRAGRALARQAVPRRRLVQGGAAGAGGG